MAGNWRQQLAHFEEWLCALLLPCPRLLPLLLWGGLGGRESFDYFHRLRLIPGKGHCSLWAAETKRLPREPRANNSQDRPAPKNNSPAQHTHSSQITPTLIGVEELCSASVHFLSGMAVDAALSSVSGDKEEKAACSSNRGRVGPKLEVVICIFETNIYWSKWPLVRRCFHSPASSYPASSQPRRLIAAG